VISSNTHGAQEIIRPGKNGLLVFNGQIDEFLTAIQDLLSDQSKCAGLSKEGIKTSNSYTWKAAADKMERLLSELLGSR
jgi:glycosyltransferase involved in cell wall biosynthesis